MMIELVIHVKNCYCLVSKPNKVNVVSITSARCYKLLPNEWIDENSDCLAVLSGISSDSTILVQEGKVKVNKKLLTSLSPFFDDLFKNNINEVKIKNIGRNNLLQLMSFMYQVPGKCEIKSENVEFLLGLAEKFKILSITKRCEYFLKISTDIKLGKKLLISQTFGLKEVQDNAMTKCIKLEELNDLKKDLGSNDLDLIVYKSIFKKICSDQESDQMLEVNEDEELKFTASSPPTEEISDDKNAETTTSENEPEDTESETPTPQNEKNEQENPSTSSNETEDASTSTQSEENKKDEY